MSSIKTSTIVYASIGTVAAGCIAYAFHFDYKRRHDVEFRRSLKREAKRQAKAAKEEAQGAKTRERAEIRAMVDEANEEGFPTGADEKEAFFMEEVGIGEKLCQTDELKAAALSFFKALRVYPQPNELMNIYDKTVPKPVLDILAEMVAYDRVSGGAQGAEGKSSAASSTAGVE